MSKTSGPNRVSMTIPATFTLVKPASQPKPYVERSEIPTKGNDPAYGRIGNSNLAKMVGLTSRCKIDSHRPVRHIAHRRGRSRALQGNGKDRSSFKRCFRVDTIVRPLVIWTVTIGFDRTLILPALKKPQGRIHLSSREKSMPCIHPLDTETERPSVISAVLMISRTVSGASPGYQ